MNIQRIEDKLSVLYEKADRITKVYGLEHPKTIRAWEKYDKYFNRVSHLLDFSMIN